MGQVLHGNAKTTHAIRSELQRSQASVASLAKRYGINEKTVLKWRHRQSVASAERDVAIYSVIETAKLNGIEPQAYIADVIEKFASGWPASRWDELRPWNWQPTTQHIAQAVGGDKIAVSPYSC